MNNQVILTRSTALTGSGLAPGGSRKEVSNSLLLRYRPPLPGFAWRNGIMIKADDRYRGQLDIGPLSAVTRSPKDTPIVQ